ncbi:MAG: FAD binding domain-containing protein [Candidatus Rokuibacteriota bacterium]
MRPGFAYHRPATVEEACRILVAEPEATVLAGGTDLMVHLRQPWRGKRPSAVVNVKRIPGLAAIEVTERAARLGALASLTALIEHPLIRSEYPVLPFTARYMGSPAIRNLATVGGNLCNASPAADLPPVLLALDAEVWIVGPSGHRRLPLDAFFRGPGQTVLGAGELLAWVEFPRRRPAWPIRYERLDVRRAMDIAIAGAALSVDLEGGRVRAARVALCAVAPTPGRVPAAEAVLVEGGLAGEAIEHAAELCMIAAQPITDMRATAEYRREMVGTLVRRGLQRIRDGDVAEGLRVV